MLIDTVKSFQRIVPSFLAELFLCTPPYQRLHLLRFRDRTSHFLDVAQDASVVTAQDWEMLLDALFKFHAQGSQTFQGLKSWCRLTSMQRECDMCISDAAFDVLYEIFTTVTPARQRALVALKHILVLPTIPEVRSHHTAELKWPPSTQNMTMNREQTVAAAPGPHQANQLFHTTLSDKEPFLSFTKTSKEYEKNIIYQYPYSLQKWLFPKIGRKKNFRATLHIS